MTTTPGWWSQLEDDVFDGVVAAAEVVCDLAFGERLGAFEGDFVAVAVDVDLDVMSIFLPGRIMLLSVMKPMRSASGRPSTGN